MADSPQLSKNERRRRERSMWYVRTTPPFRMGPGGWWQTGWGLVVLTLGYLIVSIVAWVNRGPRAGALLLLVTLGLLVATLIVFVIVVPWSRRTFASEMDRQERFVQQIEEKAGASSTAGNTSHTTGDIITVDGVSYEYYGRNLIPERNIAQFHCHQWATDIFDGFVILGPFSAVVGRDTPYMVIVAVFWGLLAGFSLFDLAWLEPRWDRVVSAPQGPARTKARRQSVWVAIACFVAMALLVFAVQYLVFLATGVSFQPVSFGD